MLYSGIWHGYWEQVGWGRQRMLNISFRFSDGQISGEGQDILGKYTFQGTYEAGGIVKLIKQYLGRHSVFYTGTYDGEGTIFGQWMVSPGNVGPFVLQPQRPESVADLPIRDL